MRKLTVFNAISLDGYFTDAKGDMSWAHKQDAEWKAFAADNASGGGALVFGRITYEMMAAFWPTPAAFEANAVVAEKMNNLPKIVFSTTLEKSMWNNTTLVKGDIAAEMRRLKNDAGPDMVILGSGTIVTQLAEARLIDGYQVVLNPIVLGSGRTMFDGVHDRQGLRLTQTRPFSNGNVVLSYEPTD